MIVKLLSYLLAKDVACVVFAAFILTTFISKIYLHLRKCVDVPAVGYGPLPYLGSWIGAIRFSLNPRKYIQRGYDIYRSGVFKISTIQREHVIVCDKSKIDEFLAAPDTVLSNADALEEDVQGRWTIGYALWDHLFHISYVRAQFAPNMVRRFDGMQEEIQICFDEYIGHPDDWKDVQNYWVMAKVIARVSNYAFGGTELAHNRPYIFTAIHYPRIAVGSAELLKPLPQWIKKYAVYLTPAHWTIKLANSQIGGYIQDRINGSDEEHGKRDDLLQWLIDHAPPSQRTREELLRRMWSLNLGSLHTTAITITSALSMLSSEFEKYGPELRSEIEEHCPDNRFTKAGLDKCLKLDSFLRETCRLNDFGVAFVNRKARQRFVFSDGTVIPVGAILSTPKYALHRNPAAYPDPNNFDGFRYSRGLRSSDTSKTRLTDTSLDFVYFGHGRHACAGRFFAAMELKLIMANLLVRYDIQPTRNSSYPARYIGVARIPNYGMKIRLRSRR